MIEVHSRPEANVPGAEKVVVRAAEAALRQAGRAPEGVDMTVVLAGDDEIAELNRRFRGVDSATDVLSFQTGDEDLTGELASYLGDVIISADRARAQAAEAGHPLEEELALLVAHGTLHLLGYDHLEEAEEREMWALQQAAVQEALDARA
ncbi:MAG: rRNA maturation RNase YbeY [Anaerolineae bacterium]|nr:rRNA maturation RNase YbeY [Anaerolineae bacterium]